MEAETARETGRLPSAAEQSPQPRQEIPLRRFLLLSPHPLEEHLERLDFIPVETQPSTVRACINEHHGHQQRENGRGDRRR